MKKERNSGNRRRVFMCRMAAVSVLSALDAAGVWAADRSHLGAVFPDRNGSGAVADEILPLSEKPEPDIFLAARILLAQQYLDPQTRLVPCPTAFLQRHLRLSYRKACRLAEALEKNGDWSLPVKNCRTVYSDRLT